MMLLKIKADFKQNRDTLINAPNQTSVCRFLSSFGYVFQLCDDFDLRSGLRSGIARGAGGSKYLIAV